MQTSPIQRGKATPGARTRAVVIIYLAGIMNINGFKRGVLIGAIMLGMGLSLPAAAGGSGWHGGGGGWHGGGGGWHGGGWHGGSWHSDAWWGLGLGLVGGYAAATIANSYYYPSYPAYSYYYPAPTYYYPAYGYSGYAYAPAAQVDPNYAQPVPVQTAASPPPAANWYYCASAKGYYPNVPRCPEPWHMVPSTPPGPVR